MAEHLPGICWLQQNKTIPSRNGFWDRCSNCRYPGIHGGKALFLVTGLVAHWKLGGCNIFGRKPSFLSLHLQAFSSLESVFSNGPFPVVIPHWLSEQLSPPGASSWAPSGRTGGLGRPRHLALPTLYELISSGFLWVEQAKLALPHAERE